MKASIRVNSLTLGGSGPKTLSAMEAHGKRLDRSGQSSDERQPSWPVPTTTLAGGAERKTGMPVWRAAPPA